MGLFSSLSNGDVLDWVKGKAMPSIPITTRVEEADDGNKLLIIEVDDGEIRTRIEEATKMVGRRRRDVAVGLGKARVGFIAVYDEVKHAWLSIRQDATSRDDEDGDYEYIG